MAQAHDYVSGGKQLQKLLMVPLNELKNRQQKKAEFESAMDKPIEIITDRCHQLSIYGRPINVRKYPGKREFKVFTDMILEFDLEYSDDYRSRAQPSNMPFISEFILSQEHFQETPYPLNFAFAERASVVYAPALEGGLTTHKLLMASYSARCCNLWIILFLTNPV